MKWLVRMATGKKKTPMPPKPYVDVDRAGKHMSDPRYYDMDNLAHTDPEHAHWKEGRFESRSSVPVIDIFGFNRDWSWSMFKVASLIFVGVFYYEYRLMMTSNAEDVQIMGSGVVQAQPKYVRSDANTEEELRKAGFAFVGVKDLDHLAEIRDKYSPPPPR